MKVNLIFPNQLFEDLSLISNKNKTFLVEDGEFFTAFNFHKNKLVLHRAAMKFYESYLLKNGFDVEYVDFKKDWLKILKQNNIDEIITYELNNLELEEKIKKAKFKVAYLKSPMFLSSNEEFKDFLLQKHIFLKHHFIFICANSIKYC